LLWAIMTKSIGLEFVPPCIRLMVSAVHILVESPTKIFYAKRIGKRGILCLHLQVCSHIDLEDGDVPLEFFSTTSGPWTMSWKLCCALTCFLAFN
jgi:hypothetical protein